MSPDKFSPEVRSYIMSRIRSKGTKCERTLRATLVGRGIKGFKLHYDAIGIPDFAFPEKKVAVFCDSDFWHGFKPMPTSHKSYWTDKIRRNISRDKLVSSELRQNGWLVLRLRESHILSSPAQCADYISRSLQRRA